MWGGAFALFVNLDAVIGQRGRDGLRGALQLSIGSEQYQGASTGGNTKLGEAAFDGALVSIAVGRFGDVIGDL
jgi:hypothetical protein